MPIERKSAWQTSDEACTQAELHQQAYEDEHRRATQLQERVTHLETELARSKDSHSAAWKHRDEEAAKRVAAERERDEARAELAKVRALYTANAETTDGEGGVIDQLAKARMERDHYRYKLWEMRVFCDKLRSERQGGGEP